MLKSIGSSESDGFLRTEQLRVTEARTAEPLKSSFAMERYAIITLLFLMLVLRIHYASRFRFDTDEAQHLHVVWGWTNGLIPYRDLFDNHGPLFHSLCAVLLWALGERPDILILARLAMIPLLALSLFFIFKIGRNLGSRQIGMWAAVFTGFYPEFFFTSTEFRTDNLWTVLWLGIIVIATREQYTKKSAFLIGFLLGMAFCVTVKTGLMMGALLFAELGVLTHQWLRAQTIDRRFIAACVSLGVAGFAIMPLSWFTFFSLHGATKEFVYCNVFHNLVPHAQNWERMDAHFLWFPLCLLFSLGILGVFRDHDFSSTEYRRMFLVFAAVSYFSALKTFFPTLSRQDDLPFIPLACLLTTTMLIALLTRRTSFADTFGRLMPYSFPAMALLEVLLVIVTVPLSRDDTKKELATLSTILRATRMCDYVMDPTGEVIFRRRPFYYALESFTAVRIERGLIHDDIVQEMIKTGTPVALPHGLTKNAKAFVHQNYLDVGNGVWVLGKHLIPSVQNASATPIAFSVAVPGSYRILKNGEKDVAGQLDGSVAIGPRFLDAGEHYFLSNTADYSGLYLFWNTALERGVTPLSSP